MTTFPRDPNSAFNHITSEAIGQSVQSLLTDGFRQRALDGNDRHIKALLDGVGAWNIIEVLKVGATCAFLNGLGEEDYHAALLRQALRDHGFA